LCTDSLYIRKTRGGFPGRNSNDQTARFQAKGESTGSDVVAGLLWGGLHCCESPYFRKESEFSGVPEAGKNLAEGGTPNPVIFLIWKLGIHRECDDKKNRSTVAHKFGGSRAEKTFDGRAGGGKKV